MRVTPIADKGCPCLKSIISDWEPLFKWKGVFIMHLSLYNIRKQKGLSIDDLEKLTGVPRSSINRIECGAVCIQLLNLKALAQVLNASIDELIEEPEMAEPVKEAKSEDKKPTLQVVHKDEVVQWWEKLLNI